LAATDAVIHAVEIIFVPSQSPPAAPADAQAVHPFFLPPLNLGVAVESAALSAPSMQAQSKEPQPSFHCIARSSSSRMKLKPKHPPDNTLSTALKASPAETTAAKAVTPAIAATTTRPVTPYLFATACEMWIWAF